MDDGRATAADRWKPVRLFVCFGLAAMVSWAMLIPIKQPLDWKIPSAGQINIVSGNISYMYSRYNSIFRVNTLDNRSILLSCMPYYADLSCIPESIKLPLDGAVIGFYPGPATGFHWSRGHGNVLMSLSLHGAGIVSYPQRVEQLVARKERQLSNYNHPKAIYIGVAVETILLGMTWFWASGKLIGTALTLRRQRTPLP